MASSRQRKSSRNRSCQRQTRSCTGLDAGRKRAVADRNNVSNSTPAPASTAPAGIKVVAEVKVSGQTRPSRDMRQLVLSMQQQMGDAAAQPRTNQGVPDAALGAGATVPDDDLGRQLAQGGASRTEALHDRDDCNRDASGDQTILDGRCAAFVFEKLDHVHDSWVG